MGLEEMRKNIDNVDDGILGLLRKRVEFSRGISRIKQTMGRPILDEQRERQIIHSLKKTAGEKGLDEDFVVSLYRIIMENSKKVQAKEQVRENT